MTFSEKLAMAMHHKKISIRELSESTGIPKSAIQRYTSGDTEKIPIDRMILMAQALGIDPAYVMGWNAEASPASPFGKPVDGLIPRSQVRTRHVPILGDTAAGEPVIANREYDEWVEVPDDGHHFDAALRVTGDSMAPKYQKGDLVFVRYQEDVQDGQIAVICLNDGVTLKRLYHIPDGVQLLSENRDYPPMVFTAADGNAHLVGLAVGVLHWDH